MKRLILFSLPTEEVINQLEPLLFPAELAHKVFAYMPCGGLPSNEGHERLQQQWQHHAYQHGAEFLLIDNAAMDSASERAKLQRANILFITGGNTCILLQNLRRSGLDQAILDLAQKEQYVIAGFSAGALLLTPSIELEAVAFDGNTEMGLTDFQALHLVDYEVLPHYTADFKDMLEEYRQTRSYEVKTLTDDEFIVVER